MVAHAHTFFVIQHLVGSKRWGNLAFAFFFPHVQSKGLETPDQAPYI